MEADKRGESDINSKAHRFGKGVWAANVCQGGMKFGKNGVEKFFHEKLIIRAFEKILFYSTLLITITI